MKKERYMLKFVFIVYGVSLVITSFGLIELMQYMNDTVISKRPLLLGVIGSVLLLLLYISTFIDEVKLGKMKKSALNFIIGFIPVLSTVIFNIVIYIFLNSQI